MGNDPLFDLRSELYRIAGVDLTDIPGVSAIAAQVVLTEVGPDVCRFRNASAFASWLGLCPDIFRPMELHIYFGSAWKPICPAFMTSFGSSANGCAGCWLWSPTHS
jgi:hypothetical protein